MIKGVDRKVTALGGKLQPEKFGDITCLPKYFTKKRGRFNQSKEEDKEGKEHAKEHIE